MSNVENNWILTYTGKKFFPLTPRHKDIDIIDIAHALSNMCRFTGHCREFYSVAQHSVLVAEQVWNKTLDSQRALTGLLHDASEAYLIDVAKPVKHSPQFAFYREAEDVLQEAICARFNLIFDDSNVKRADDYLLKVEAFHLMPKHPEWTLMIEQPKDFPDFECWSPERSKNEFLDRFLEFNGHR